MLTRRAFGRGMGAGVATALLRGSAVGRSQAARDGGVGAGRCSVMLWALASAVPRFDDRLELVARAGYRQVELVDEFRSWTEADWTRILGRMRILGLRVDAVAPLRMGFADPAGAGGLSAELESVLPSLRRLGSPQIILVSGPRRPVSGAPLTSVTPLTSGTPSGSGSDGLSESRQRAALVERLRGFAAVLEREGMTAVIEPIDRIENPVAYLDTVTDGFAITRAVGSPRLKVLYDFFHEQRTHGDLIEKLDGNIGEIGLVHVADVPGRHQPGTGEVSYANIYRALRRLGYGGRVAMEFYPQGDAAEVLRAARVEAEGLLGA